MLLRHVGGLSKARIVLASGSPRRRELLGSMGLKFEVCVSTFEETLPHDDFTTADHYALETGERRALRLQARIIPARFSPRLMLLPPLSNHSGCLITAPGDVAALPGSPPAALPADTVARSCQRS